MSETRTQLNPRSLAILYSKGWNGLLRDIESDLADAEYMEIGSPPKYALSALEKYSGIEFETISKHEGCRLEIYFGLDKACEIGCSITGLAEHETIIGKKLYPVGAIEAFEIEEHGGCIDYIIMISEDGNVYRSMPYFISQVGYDIEDFINKVVEDKPLWKSNENLSINYSYHDPRLRELRKKELVEKRMQRAH